MVRRHQGYVPMVTNPYCGHYQSVGAFSQDKNSTRTLQVQRGARSEQRGTAFFHLGLAVFAHGFWHDLSFSVEWEP